MEKEYMRAVAACLDCDTLWMIDEMLCGLYAVDMNTWNVRCVLNFEQLFRYGKYMPVCLIKRGAEHILIVPFEINQKWIIYNKATGRIDYKEIVPTKGRCNLAGIDSFENIAYFTPASTKDSFLAVDLMNLTCVDGATDGYRKIGEKTHTTFESWSGGFDNHVAFCAFRKTDRFLCFSYKNKEPVFHEIKLPEKAADADLHDGEIWMLPVEGTNIYWLDHDGAVLERIDLKVDEQYFFASDFARIIAQKNYIFLLPYRYHGILVYDKRKKEMSVIGGKDCALPEIDRFKGGQYWGYCIINDKICFLPEGNKFLEADLDTLEYRQRDLFLPAEREDGELLKRNSLLLAMDHGLQFTERDKYALEAFIGFVSEGK